MRITNACGWQYQHSELKVVLEAVLDDLQLLGLNLRSDWADSSKLKFGGQLVEPYPEHQTETMRRSIA